jgi:hypothetical protein
MFNRTLAAGALLSSMGLGIGVALLASISGDPKDSDNSIQSVRGVNSGAGGSDVEEPERKGVEPIQSDKELSDTQESSAKKDQTDTMASDNRAVDIRGVRGTDGTTVQEENTIESISSDHGSIQSIRGIEGIDTVPLQNLETVLRVQQRPEEQPSGGGSRSAAGLLTMEGDEQVETEEVTDGREELVEFEMEGS